MTTNGILGAVPGIRPRQHRVLLTVARPLLAAISNAKTSGIVAVSLEKRTGFPTGLQDSNIDVRALHEAKAPVNVFIEPEILLDLEGTSRGSSAVRA